MWSANSEWFVHCLSHWQWLYWTKPSAVIRVAFSFTFYFAFSLLGDYSNFIWLQRLAQSNQISFTLQSSWTSNKWGKNHITSAGLLLTGYSCFLFNSHTHTRTDAKLLMSVGQAQLRQLSPLLVSFVSNRNGVIVLKADKLHVAVAVAVAAVAAATVVVVVSRMQSNSCLRKSAVIHLPRFQVRFAGVKCDWPTSPGLREDNRLCALETSVSKEKMTFIWSLAKISCLK